MPESELSSTPERSVSKSKILGRNSRGLNLSFVDALGWLITFFWSISFVLDAAIKTYDPPVSLHPLMMLVAGAAFTSSFLKDKNSKNTPTNGDDNDNP